MSLANSTSHNVNMPFIIKCFLELQVSAYEDFPLCSHFNPLQSDNTLSRTLFYTAPRKLKDNEPTLLQDIKARHPCPTRSKPVHCKVQPLTANTLNYMHHSIKVNNAPLFLLETQSGHEVSRPKWEQRNTILPELPPDKISFLLLFSLIRLFVGYVLVFLKAATYTVHCEIWLLTTWTPKCRQWIQNSMIKITRYPDDKYAMTTTQMKCLFLTGLGTVGIGQTLVKGIQLFILLLTSFCIGIGHVMSVKKLPLVCKLHCQVSLSPTCYEDSHMMYTWPFEDFDLSIDPNKSQHLPISIPSLTHLPRRQEYFNKYQITGIFQ